MINIVRVANVLTALKPLKNVCCSSVHARFSSICQGTGVRMMHGGWLRFRLLFVKYLLMHMTSWPGFKSDLKYRLVAIRQSIVEYIIVAEVAAGLHIIFGVAIPLKLFDNKKLATVFKHKSGDFLLYGVHL